VYIGFIAPLNVASTRIAMIIQQSPVLANDCFVVPFVLLHCHADLTI